MVDGRRVVGFRAASFNVDGVEGFPLGLKGKKVRFNGKVLDLDTVGTNRVSLNRQLGEDMFIQVSLREPKLIFSFTTSATLVKVSKDSYILRVDKRSIALIMKLDSIETDSVVSTKDDITSFRPVRKPLLPTAEVTLLLKKRRFRVPFSKTVEILTLNDVVTSPEDAKKKVKKG